MAKALGLKRCPRATAGSSRYNGTPGTRSGRTSVSPNPRSLEKVTPTGVAVVARAAGALRHRSADRGGRVRLRAGADRLREIHAAAAGAGLGAAHGRQHPDRWTRPHAAGSHTRLRAAKVLALPGQDCARQY